MTFGSIAISAPYVAAILLLVIVLWIVSVNTLGYKFNSLVAEQEGATAEEPLLNVV